MSRVSPWRRMMRQECLIAERTGRDERGKPTFGSDTRYRCRLVGEQRQVLDDEGRQVTSNQTVYLASGDRVSPDARVTLSTGDVKSTEAALTQPPILATGQYPDETGKNVYTALFLK